MHGDVARERGVGGNGTGNGKTWRAVSGTSRRDAMRVQPTAKLGKAGKTAEPEGRGAHESTSMKASGAPPVSSSRMGL